MYYQSTEQNSAINLPGKLLIALAGIIAGFLICRIFIQPFTVETSSMEPNFKKGQRVLISRFGTLKTGTVVLAENPADDGTVTLKRIVASENDTVEIRNKIIYINNRKVSFPWKTKHSDSRIFPLTLSNRDEMRPVRLGKDQYFLMGDNIDRSFDSRALGVFTSDMIKGHVIYSF